MIPEILVDESLSEEDKVWIRKFEIKIEEVIKLLIINGENISLQHFDFHELLMKIDLDSSQLNKEGTLMYALWVTLLSILKKHILVTQMKYPTLESFCKVYSDSLELCKENDADIRKLWYTANWMTYLFSMVTAKKNKGLAMIVIPKLLEGWHVKYITGSGQKKATCHRVHIFEYEGNVKANHRGKKKNSSEDDENSVAEDDHFKHKYKKHKKDSYMNDNNYDFKPPQKKYKKAHQHGVDGDDLADHNIPRINTEFPTTFSAWQEATENYGLGLLALSRSNSHTNVKVEGNISSNIGIGTDGIDFQRDYSWADFVVGPLTSLTEDSVGDAIPLTRVFSLNNEIDNKASFRSKEHYSVKELPRLPSAPFRESSECWSEVPIIPSSAPLERHNRSSIPNKEGGIFPITELPRLPSAPFRMSSTCWTEIPIIPGVPPTKDFDSWRANMIMPSTRQSNTHHTENHNPVSSSSSSAIKLATASLINNDDIEDVAQTLIASKNINEFSSINNTSNDINNNLLQSKNDESVITSDALLSLFNGYHS